MSSVFHDKDGFSASQHGDVVYIRFHGELLYVMPCDRELTEAELADRLKEYRAMRLRYDDREHSGLIDD